MDDNAFAQMLADMDQSAAAPPSPQPAPAPASTSDASAPQRAPGGQQAAGPQASTPAPMTGQDEGLGVQMPRRPGQQVSGLMARPEAGLSDPSSTFLDAPYSGAMKALFETKDFLTGGAPAEADKSALRKSVEAGPGAANEGTAYRLVEGVSQFATGLVGAGKLLRAAEGAKAVGSAFTAVRGIRGGAAALEAGKAAAAGAVVLDPHGQRLSNLIQDAPALRNPVTQFLAAQPGDSAAMGRLKNGLESIGMDAALIGTVTAAAKAYKVLALAKAGKASAEEVHAATGELEGAMDGHNAMREQAEAKPPPADTMASFSQPAEPTPTGGTAPAPEEHALTITPQETPGAPTQAADTGAQLPQASGPDDAQGGAAGVPARVAEPATPQAAGLADAPALEAHTDLNGAEWQKAAPGEPWTPKSPEPAPEALPAAEAGVEPNTAQSAANGAAPEPSVEQVPRGAGTGAPDRQSGISITPEQRDSIIAGMRSDLDAMDHFGSFDDAVAEGHIFAKGGSIPYQKLFSTQGEGNGMDALLNNVAQGLKEHLDAAKGGDVLTDASLNKWVQQRVNLWGEDPEALYGLLQRAGKSANTMAANMEAAYLVAERGFQDAFTLASRIKMGDLAEFGGSQAAAMEALDQRLAAATTAWGSGQAMRSSAGRAMRRMRSDFRFTQEQLDRLKSLDPQAKLELLDSAGGDPRALQRLTTPGMLERLRDWSQTLYVNNLLWGWKTHLVNLTTNAYMVGARPLERMIGSAVQASGVLGADAAAAGKMQFQESARQYAYMGRVLGDSWESARQAFLQGDSVLMPHHATELAQGTEHSTGNVAQEVTQMPWAPMSDLGGVVKNALIFGQKSLILPGRLTGAQDELMKNITYRSVVQAKAHVEAISQGLQGAELTAFVKNRLYGAFDDAGRALDADALKEAQTATFQNDLLPNTMGKWVQNGTANVPGLRVILPFVKTPTNLLRYGWKLTPGLNLLQTQYRQMLSGAMGAEAQSQAIGQMALGALFTGSAYWMAQEGRITGGGPSDPKLKQAAMATGWRPYSFVSYNDDGSRTYTPFDRYDPVALPLGILADVVDVLHANPDSRAIQAAGNVMAALGLGMLKNITDKTYLKSVSDTIQALQDPDHKWARLAGTMSSNFVPFASALRNYAVPLTDPTLRDARNFADYTLRELPGFSDTLPAKRDAFGDPLTVNPGLSVQAPGNIVDSEMRRLATTAGGDGATLSPPSPSVGGIDLRQVTMKDGRNAYDRYQELARQPTRGATPVKDRIAKLMDTDTYRNAPDGEAGTKGTKLWMLAQPMARYRQAALKVLRQDANVREAMFAKQKAAIDALANSRAKQNPTPQNAQNDATQSLMGGLTRAFGAMTQPSP